MGEKVRVNAYRPNEYWARLHREHAAKLSAVGYGALGEGFNRVCYGRRLRAAERILRFSASPFPPSRVLEAGVGVGAYSRLWEPLGVREWVGVDISAEAIAALRKRFPNQSFHEVDLASRDEVSWRPVRERAPYDAITAIDVLYHVIDDEKWVSALQNLAVLLRPGGVLVVSDVFVDATQQRAPHVRRHPLSEYRAVLEGSGLSLVRREPVFAVLGDPVPHTGFHPMERFMSGTWRIMQKGLRVTPAVIRGPVGAATATVLSPLDALLCRLGVTEGVNLELAAFRRM
jgi:SAM-dependent methyltransferase